MRSSRLTTGQVAEKSIVDDATDACSLRRIFATFLADSSASLGRPYFYRQRSKERVSYHRPHRPQFDCCVRFEPGGPGHVAHAQCASSPRAASGSRWPSCGKKAAQLIRLGGKKYGTVITVTQMCKKSEKVTCTAKHIVDEMWKQWQIEGGKEKGEENADDEDETTLSKVDEKNKGKGKDRLKDKDDKGKKKETRTCNHCQMKGHIKVNCWKKNPSLMPEKFKGKKTEKAGAAVEEEVLLSHIDVCDDNIILDTGASMI
jgi:hypothetical protein